MRLENITHFAMRLLSRLPLSRLWPGGAVFAAGFLAAHSVAAADPALPPSGSLLTAFRAGPMAGVDEFIIAARKPNETDGHWYANIGYYAHDANRKGWREGGKLYRWNCVTEKLTALLDDPRGGVRDPQVHYDGQRILFSYRKGGTEAYHMFEINADGSGLRQLTDGEYDDIEPTYLPNGDIVFVSTRCKRWVNCWLTQVATLYRCGPNGENIHPLSSNNEQDNTPWPLPDGRLIYTRWEYVDRSQVDYHHLWAANPDGTAQVNWYGNLHPGILMIDAKPIPGSEKVVALFSPGHGQREHAGQIMVVDPKAGPDDKAFARPVGRGNQFRDPWAFSEQCFVAALDAALVVVDGSGARQEIFKLPEADIQAGMQLHEPRPLAPRPRERVIPERVQSGEASGRLVLADIYDGRNMAGVKRGDIKKLLVLETLPMPIHYTGGMDPMSYGGTFTLERIVGTVPVEEDGSAYLELPALRSFFLVALDENDLSVKRMQSFLTVQPGETTSCVGCHEPRTKAPSAAIYQSLAAKRPASTIQPIADVPDVMDFPRDIQPVLDALCVRCHDYDKTDAGGPRAGRLILSGDHGPMFSHSYYMMTVAGLFSDGRNQARSSYDPRSLGSSASRILKMLDGSHYQVKATPQQAKLLRLWIESGAAYPGTYAALGTGMIGGYAENNPVNTDWDWPETKAAGEVIARRCARCHEEPSRLLPKSLSDERGVSFWQPSMKDPRLNTSRHIAFNLSRPEKSLLLLAPLATGAGGWELCRDPNTHQPVTVFESTNDPDYQKLLAQCVAGKDYLDRVKRFDMPGFKPRTDWVREMKRYGVLPATASADAALDFYLTERTYWKSLWHSPQS
jgi:cytochrome c553